MVGPEASARWHHHVRSLASPRSKETIQDLLGIALITGALLIYGVLQERIMTIGFGPKSELFEQSIFLVLCNRLVTCIVAFACVALTGADVKPAAPLLSYCTVSFTNVVATSCQYEALKYVSFAIQTLAKSAKAFPVMLWGTFFGGKRYKPAEYLHAGALCIGCTVFVMGGKAASRIVTNTSDSYYYLFGAALMLLYLAVDGLTSTCQDHMFSTYPMTIYDQVLYTTACSTLLSFVGSVASGQLLPALMFVVRNPDALYVILALSASSACVQLIISYTIKRYGALVFATIMTTRQFFSILLSCIVFRTPLKPLQWMGMLVVFGASYGRLVRGVLQRPGRHSPASKAAIAAATTTPTVHSHFQPHQTQQVLSASASTTSMHGDGDHRV